MRRALSLVPFALIPLALFAALFHVAILDIGNAGWLIRGTDNGENALGLHAYLHDATAGLSLRTTLLNAPDGVPLLFTDSNPLLGLVTRPVAAILPADAQFVGPWFLLCLILQTLFAWLLLRRHAPDRLALWAGVALLCILPTLANRFVHANLFAHWLILWSLWLFVEKPGARLRDWAPLLAITALVHSYLLVMVGAVWASAVLAAIVTDRNRLRIAINAGLCLALVAGIAIWIGAGGRYALAGNYGAFAMPLDALVNPANPSFSALLPAIPQREGRGFEGFQYLGVGLLLLLVGAAVVAMREPRPEAECRLHHRLRWLVPALVVLTLLAISNFPDIAGQRLPRFALPPVMAPLLDAVRASGRLFWPVAYTLVLVAIIVAYRLKARAGIVLVVLLVVQLADMSGMIVAIRATTAEAADHRLYVRTPDPRWDMLIASARDIAFEPADPTHDLSLFQEVAWRAASRRKPVGTVYAARTPTASAARLARDHADFAAGRLSVRRLYILLPGVSFPAAAASRLRIIDGVRVLIPISSSPRSAS